MGYYAALEEFDKPRSYRIILYLSLLTERNRHENGSAMSVNQVFKVVIHVIYMIKDKELD